jgi:hypothetical protein
MPIATYTDYRKQSQAIVAALEGGKKAADEARDDCYEASRVHETPSWPCDEAHRKEYDRLYEIFRQQSQALAEEAKSKLIRVATEVITPPDQRAEADALAARFGEALVLEVSDFEELQAALAIDRFVNVMVLVLRYDTGAVRFGNQHESLLELATRWKPYVKTHVDDMVQFGGLVEGVPPVGTDEFGRLLLGAGVVQATWQTPRPAKPSKRQITEKCFAPVVFGDGPDSGFGIFAHGYLTLLYMQQLGVVRGVTAYFDDSFIGSKDRDLAAFIANKNPGVTEVALLAAMTKRPDALLHDQARMEFEEFKPDSKPALEKGREKLAEIEAYLRGFGLAYVRGTSFKPPAKVRILPTITVARNVPIDVSYTFKRVESGLIGYKICIATDWKFWERMWKILRDIILAALAAWLARRLIKSFPLPRPIPIPIPL